MKLFNIQEIKQEHAGKNILIIATESNYASMITSVSKKFPEAKQSVDYRATFRFEDETQIVIYKIVEQIRSFNDADKDREIFKTQFYGSRFVVINSYRYQNIDEEAWYISKHYCDKYYKATILSRIYEVEREEWTIEAQREELDNSLSKPISFFQTIRYFDGDFSHSSSPLAFADFCQEYSLDLFTKVNGCTSINEDSLTLFSINEIGFNKIEPNKIREINPFVDYMCLEVDDYAGFKKVAYWSKEETKSLRLQYDDSNQVFKCKF